MLFMWRPGGANTVGMGDALVIVPGQLPLDQGAAQWASCQASRAGTSTLLDATVTTAKPGPDGRRAETGRGRSGPCVVDDREGASLT
jgi:hypothetical protein